MTEAHVWSKAVDYIHMMHSARRAIYEGLNQAGIEIPFNQIVVHTAAWEDLMRPGVASGRLAEAVVSAAGAMPRQRRRMRRNAAQLGLERRTGPPD